MRQVQRFTRLSQALTEKTVVTGENKPLISRLLSYNLLIKGLFFAFPTEGCPWKIKLHCLKSPKPRLN
jgi:hypothetical protein